MRFFISVPPDATLEVNYLPNIHLRSIVSDFHIISSSISYVLRVGVFALSVDDQW